MKENELNIFNSQIEITKAQIDIKYEQLKSLFLQSGDNLFKNENLLEEEQIKKYALKSEIIKLTIEVCEIILKLLLLIQGNSFKELKKCGHDLEKLFLKLDDYAQEIILNCFKKIKSPFNSQANKNILKSFLRTLLLQQDIDNNSCKGKLKYINVNFTELNIILKKESPNFVKARYSGESKIESNLEFLYDFAKVLKVTLDAYFATYTELKKMIETSKGSEL